jgi:hypothetical protein
MKKAEGSTLDRIEALEAMATAWERGHVTAPVLLSGGLTIVGPDGRTRAELASTPDGHVYLRQNDVNGKVRTALGVAADGTPHLLLTDGDSPAPRVEVAVEGGRPCLRLRDAEGAIRIQLQLADDGTPSIALLDDQQRPRCLVALSVEDGSPAFIKFDESGGMV